MTALTDSAAQLQPGLVDLRRRLHRTAEVGLQLPETHAAVLHAIDGLDLEIAQGRKGKRSLLSRCASRTSPYRRSTPTDCPGPITM